MDFLHDFDSDLKIVFDSLRDRLSNYPPAFRDDALKFLDKYNILDKGFNKNHISFLLPFWLQKAFRLDGETCRNMSEGFVAGLFYFLIQDAVMDTAPGEYKGDLLPLGNLFLIDFFDMYRSLFLETSYFWLCYKNYFIEWADSVIWEQREHQRQKKTYTREDLIFVAHKAAPLKIMSAAACLLGGGKDEIEQLSKSIDHIVITFQLLDDLSDWREDHAIGSCSFFLSLVMNYCGIDDFDRLDEIHVRRAIYMGGVLDLMFEIVEENHSILKSVSEYYPYLTAYHTFLYNKFKSELDEIQEEKNNRMQGGFMYMLKNGDIICKSNI